MPGAVSLWSAASPVVWVTVTLAAYRVGQGVSRRSGAHPLANPVLLSAGMVIVVLLLSGTPYQTYFDGARVIHFLVGPATVALAIPLYAQIGRLRTMAAPLLVGLLAGSLTAITSAAALGWVFGATPATVLALAAKSTTMPIAMGILGSLDGIPSLAALTVTMTGIAGAILAAPLLKLLRIDDPAVGGFAVGITSHAIGTAAALRVSKVAGGFAALAMSLNGLATALLLPLLVRLIGWR